MEDKTIQARRQNPLETKGSLSRGQKFPIKEKNAPLGFFFLFLYTVAVFIRPHEFSVETSQYIVIKIFAIFSFIFTLFTLRPFKLYPQHYLLLGLTPLIMVSAFANGWGTGGIYQAQHLFVASILPMFLYSVLITSSGRQRLLMAVSIVAALGMVMNGHIQQSNFNGVYGTGIGGSITVGKEEMRISYLGFFNDPNDLGMFLVMNIPFVGLLYQKGGFVKKLVALSIFIALLYGIYMTGSRGTLLGALGLISVYFFLKKAGTKLVIIASFLAPVVATLLASFGGLSSQEASARGRLDAWYDGVLMLLHNPVLGVGMGNFRDVHGKVAHNSYIHVAGELGVIGYSLWGGTLMLTMYIGYALLKKTEYLKLKSSNAEGNEDLLKEELIISNTLFFSMVGFLITAFFLSRQFTLLLFIFMGMQIASFTRITKLNPLVLELVSATNVWRAIGFAWVIILVVYMALKVGL